MTADLTSPRTGAKVHMVEREYDEEASMLGLNGPEESVELIREDGVIVRFDRSLIVRDREYEVTKVIYHSPSGHKLTVWND